MQCYKKNWIENTVTGDYLQVDCGKCNFCLANRRDDWAFRMNEEAKHSQTNHFITLTYDQKNVPRVYDDKDKMYLTLRKEECYKFLHNMKKFQRRNLSKREREEWKIKYYAVGEYGSEEFTTRPHYHLITFNTHPLTLEAMQDKKIWGKGIVDASNVNGGAAAYCAKYIIDRLPFPEEDPREECFSTMSRGRTGGIASKYMETNGWWHRAPDMYNPDEFRLYRLENGYYKRLPRYFKKKLKIAEREDRQEILNLAYEIYYEEMQEKIKADYKKEIERLSKLHPHPELYYLERQKQQYDNVRIKSLKLNKL